MGHLSNIVRKSIQKLFSQPFILKQIERLTASKVYLKLPLGFDPFVDISYRFQEYNIDVIFDIGANVGQSAQYFKTKHPNAKIFCFEPVSATFEALTTNTARQNIQCFQNAVGDKIEDLQFIIDKENPTSVFNSTKKNTAHGKHTVTETVKSITLDSFTKQYSIDRINYLKIDTEGNDLNVLKGATKLINTKKIDFIEVELSMNPFNQDHVPFLEVTKFLQENEYYIFGIYEQIQDFKLKKYILRRANVLFISHPTASLK